MKDYHPIQQYYINRERDKFGAEERSPRENGKRKKEKSCEIIAFEGIKIPREWKVDSTKNLVTVSG